MEDFDIALFVLITIMLVWIIAEFIGKGITALMNATGAM